MAAKLREWQFATVAVSMLLLCVHVNWTVAGVDNYLMPDSSCTNPRDFDCNSGPGSTVCVESDLVCDNKNDCPNGSDEVDCDYYLCRLPLWFRCKGEKAPCISTVFQCDGSFHCPLDDDEDNCVDYVPHHEPTNCTSDQFRCVADDMCISLDETCDGRMHCLDNSDEASALCSRPARDRCGPKAFICANGHCLEDRRWVCDGQDDCGDRSDEADCAAKDCELAAGRFRCADRKTCLPLDKVCDGHADCPGAADDEGGSCAKGSPGVKDHCPLGQCSAAGGTSVNCLLLPSGPVCVCRMGLVYNATSRECEDINECDNYASCSQSCINTYGSFSCNCTKGFQLQEDGHTCVLKSNTAALLLFAGATSVTGLELNGHPPLHQFQVANNTQHVIGITYDGRFAYWTDIQTTAESIVRARRDGSGQEVLLTSGLSAPEDIAVDWITGNLYFTDRLYQHIAVCSNDGHHCAGLLTVGMEQPRSLVLLPQRSEMYWTDWERRIIGRAAMDGSASVPFVSDDLHWPNGVTADWPNERIYWVDAKLDRIESIRFDGSDRRLVLDGILKSPHGVAVFESHVYWSDWATKSIQRCDKFTGKHRENVIKDQLVYDIHIYHKSLQPKNRDPCADAKCSHLCLLSTNVRGFTCACPEGWQLLDAVDATKCKQLVKPQRLLIAKGFHMMQMEHRTFGRQIGGEEKTLSMRIDAMAQNSRTGTIYVASNVENMIVEVDMQTMRTTRLVDGGLSNVVAMAFDELGENVFWADAQRATVECISLHTGARAIVKHFTGLRPVAMTVLPARGELIVAVRNNVATTNFVRLAMHGRGEQHNVWEIELGADAVQLVHDRDAEQLYWLDQEAQKIMFTDYEFRMNHTFVSNLDHPATMAILEDEVFWTTVYSSRVHWSPKHRPSDKKHLLVEMPLSFFPFISPRMHLLGLQSVRMPASLHVCYTPHDKCTHICVPLGATTFACLCPPGMVFTDRTNQSCMLANECAFRCGSGECLAQSHTCDGRKDCADGSDEDECIPPSSSSINSAAPSSLRQRPHRCSFDEFECDNASHCIPRTLLCDRHSDCADDSDESTRECAHFNHTTRCRQDQFQCPDGLCIDSNAVCDESLDCSDGADEQRCSIRTSPSNGTATQSKFCCVSGQCLPASWQCDGILDCTDGSDEVACAPLQCPAAFFRCPFGQCIDRKLVCDGHNHCGDNADEMHCDGAVPIAGADANAKHTQIACGEVDSETRTPTMFQCARNPTVCLPLSVRCNGTTECPHGDDEADCRAGCDSHEFECLSNGHCVNVRWLCDGEDDCGDGSDEANCTAAAGRHPVQSRCGDRSFDCGDEQTCLDDERQLCDGHPDCPNGSDEAGQCQALCTVPEHCQHECHRRPAGPVCRCRAGYRLAGDGRRCEDVNECTEQEPCAQRCDNEEGTFRCSCFEGFMLHTDKAACKAVDRRKWLLYSSYDTIYNITAQTLAVLWSSNGTRIIGMAANVATETLYWTLDGTSALYMMDMRSGRVEYIANVGAPRELAVDWSTGNVYVVDELTTPQLKVCRIEDNVCVQLFRFDYRDVVRAMVVDAVHGRVFYAAQPFAVSVVAQSVLYGHALDGSRRQVLVKEAGAVNALVCDVDKKRLFYADKSGASVWSVGYDGTGNRRMFARQEAVLRPVALALTEDQVYVFNEGSHIAAHCQAYGDRVCKSFEIGTYNADNLLIIHSATQRQLPDVCAAHNCSAMCVPAEHGPKCLCRGGAVVNAGEQCTAGTHGETAERRILHGPGNANGQANKDSGRLSVAARIGIAMAWIALACCILGTAYWMRERRLCRRKYFATRYFWTPSSSSTVRMSTVAAAAADHSLDDIGNERVNRGADGAGNRGTGGGNGVGNDGTVYRTPSRATVPKMYQGHNYNELFLYEMPAERLVDASAIEPPMAQVPQMVRAPLIFADDVAMLDDDDAEQSFADDDNLTAQLIRKD